LGEEEANDEEWDDDELAEAVAAAEKVASEAPEGEA
jgi:hypothetical protein